MFWQKEYVREDVNMTLPGTYQQELPKAGMLGSLLIRFSGSQVSGFGLSGGAWRLLDTITKVTILGNGSTPIKSFTGSQLMGISFFDQGVFPPGDWRNYETNTHFQYMLINFGRWMYDSMIGLDLARWGTVEIQIETNATSAIFTDIHVSVLGLYLRDAPASRFQGYMETLLHKAWTTVQNEWIYTDLPVEHTLRRVILQCIPGLDADNVDKTTSINMADDIDFSLDTGQIRVYRGGLDDLIRDNFLEQGKVMIAGAFPYHTADKGIDISMGRLIGYANGDGSQDGAGAAVIGTLESARSGHTLKAETKEAGSPMNVLVAGFSPFMCAQLNLDPEYDPSWWLDTTARKVVKLNIHTRDSSAAAGGYVGIILDRLVRS